MLLLFATELRAAVRRLRRSPVFFLATVLVLGLGLGANLVVTNAVYALLWRPLDFPQPERLVTLRTENATGAARITGERAGLLRDEAASLAEVGLFKGEPLMAVFMGSEVLELTAARVNSGYARALELQALAGRLFAEEEDRGGIAEERGLLSESAWVKYFRADPGVVGQLLPYQTGTERRQLRILGILRRAPTLPFAGEPDVLLSIPWQSNRVRGNFGDARYRCVLRTKPGVTLDRVSAEVQGAFDASAGGSGDTGTKQTRFVAMPLRKALAPSNARATLVLWAAAGLLLLLTCANLASLIVARLNERLQDASVRLALGASWRHLLLGYLAESLLLCLAGTIAAFGLNSLVRTWIPGFFPDIESFGAGHLATGPALVMFGGVLCTGVALLITLPASLQVRTTRLPTALSRHGGSRVSRRTSWTLGLATAQLAVVLPLLTTGGLIERSFLAALRTDSGMEPEGVVTLRVSVPIQRGDLPATASDLAHAIASIPGARRASFSAQPTIGSYSSTMVNTHGGRFSPDDPFIGIRGIGAGYFETLGARFSIGRSMTEDEVRRGDAKVVLNEAAAKALFPDANPVGRQVYKGFLGLSNTVVGVVEDIRHEALDSEPGPMAYLPYRAILSRGLTFVARTDDPALFLSTVTARVRAWHAGALVRDIRKLDDTVAATVDHRRRSGLLVGGFALLGLLVSSIGLYGTLANYVQRRRQEIAVRMALGATRYRIMQMVFVEGVRLVASGVVLGILSSVAAGHVIRQLLYGVAPVDAVSITVAVTVLSTATITASLFPALRASGMNPGSALKSM